MSALSMLTALIVWLGVGTPSRQSVEGRSSASQSQSLTIDGVSIVDVETGTLRPNMRVVVRGARIVGVGRAPAAAVPSVDPSVIDGRGKFLIPGLWDMHVHIDTTEAWFFPLSIAAGVTSVRDMGGSLARVREWKAPAKPGVLRPTIIAPGLIVTGPVADTDSRLARASTPAEGMRVVDALIDRGVDFIKVHDWLNRDTYLAVAAQARRRGSYIAGHLPIAVDPADAVRARQRSIEHMGSGWSGLLLFASQDRSVLDSVSKWASSATGPSDLMKHFTPRWQRHLADSFSPGRARAMCAQLANGRVWLTPTTYFSAYLTLMPLDAAIVRDPRLNYLPRQIRDLTQYVVPSERFSRAARNSANVRVYETRALLIRICRNAGVQFLAGTDTGPYGPMIPGFSLHDELERLVSDGFKPIEALRAATINPARFFNASDTTGSIRVGKRADLVLLDANPLTSIRNVRRINAVVVGGELLTADTRQRMLDSLTYAYR